MGVKPGFKQTEVGVIPEDWGVSRLADISDRIMVGIASAATHAYREKGVSLLRNQNIKQGYLDDSEVLYIDPDYELAFRNKRLRTGDLLTARTGYPGTTCVIPAAFDSAQSFTTLITRPRGEVIDSWYLCHYINSEHGQQFFERTQIGGAQKNVNAGTLREMPIPVTSLPEQRAIATVLSDVDALLAKLEQLLAKKRYLKQAVMQQLLTGQTRLPGFSGEWEVKQLGDLAAPRKERIDPRKHGVQEFCVELEHIESASGRLLGRTVAGDGSSLKSVFQPGDVLFGKLRAYLRKYWLADQGGVCSTEIWALAANRRCVTAEFLLQIVTTDKFVEAASVSYGTHMPRSDWNVVKNFEIALPAPPEQTAIATVLSDMDAEIAALEARRDKTRALKQGMMQELLTGRIRLV